MKVVSVDGLAINDRTVYSSWLESPHSQPPVRVEMAERVGAEPIVSQARRQAHTLNLTVRIHAATAAEAKARRKALMMALDTERAAVPLVVSDDDDTNARYRYVATRGIEELDSASGAGLAFVATLTTHGDTAWRADTATTVVWNATASGQQQVVANGGDLPARPTYTFAPTADNGVGNSWDEKRFAPITWTSWQAAQRFPVDLAGDVAFDTAALVTATTITAETEIGVIVNGQEVRRWVSRYDTTETGVWVNLDFQAGGDALAYLSAAMGSGDTVSAITVDFLPAAFPTAGMLLIGDEMFTYSGVDRIANRFTGVSRAAKGTTAAAHAAGSAAYWIQHDVWLVYGGLTRQATFDQYDYDYYKPLLDLENSTNVQWIWDVFYQSTGQRSAQWTPVSTDRHFATAIGNPADEMELSRVSATEIVGDATESWWGIPLHYFARWVRLVGRAARDEDQTWDVKFRAWGLSQELAIPLTEVVDFDINYTEPSPDWWTENLDARFYNRSRGAMEAALDGVYIEFAEWPRVRLGPVVDNYSMALTLANVTTGESIALHLATEVGQQLAVDTENYTVTLLGDGSNQYQALTKSARRRDILALRPGNNTLQVTETGLAGMTITIQFEERYYT